MKTTPVWLTSLALVALAGNAAPAQAQAVIFQFSGNAFARDYFGGAGIVSNDIALTTLTSTAVTASAVAGGAASSLSAFAIGNTATMSLSSLSAGPYNFSNFFIYTASSFGDLTPYVLGGAGTPYEITVSGVGSVDYIDPVSITSGGGGTVGYSHPGLFFTWGPSGGTFTLSGNSSANTILYNGQTYSSVIPTPSSSTDTFYGFTGSSPSTGFASAYSFHTVTTTVNNLSSYSVTPEAPGLLQLLPGLLPLGFALYKRQQHRAI